jgi:diaminopropionate ammonia-lyase
MDHRLVVPAAGRAPASLPEVPPGDPTAFHRTLPGYVATPLLDLPSLARRAGVAQVLLKDEAERLGLPAFKMLGASWATVRAVRREWTGPDVPLDLPSLRAALAAGPARRLAAATDGNHGRGVARMAALLGLGCTVYVPEGTAAARVGDIESEGATVVVVDGSYDDAILRSAQDADATTLVISDTSWPGYTETPTDVIHGYATMFREVDAALADRGAARPSHLFLQAGVGSFAAAGLLHHADAGGTRPSGWSWSRRRPTA